MKRPSRKNRVSPNEPTAIGDFNFPESQDYRRFPIGMDGEVRIFEATFDEVEHGDVVLVPGCFAMATSKSGEVTSTGRLGFTGRGMVVGEEASGGRFRFDPDRVVLQMTSSVYVQAIECDYLMNVFHASGLSVWQQHYENFLAGAGFTASSGVLAFDVGTHPACAIGWVFALFHDNDEMRVFARKLSERWAMGEPKPTGEGSRRRDYIIDSWYLLTDQRDLPIVQVSGPGLDPDDE